MLLAAKAKLGPVLLAGLLLVACLTSPSAFAQSDSQSKSQSGNQSGAQSGDQSGAQSGDQSGAQSGDQSGAQSSNQLVEQMPLAVDIQGNHALLDTVLMWVMDLPQTGPPTDEMARRAERRLRGFFQQTGYDLARVRAFAHEGVLHVLVDEGRLDKIFFTGTGSGQALRLQIDLRLPGNVYNRYAIAQELDRLEEKYGIEELGAELLVLEPSPRTYIQLQDFLDMLEGPGSAEQLWQHTRGRYALQVHAVSGEARDGLGFGAGYLLPWGLQGSVSYGGSELLFDDDSYRAYLEVAGLRNRLLTEADAGVRWSAPPFAEGGTLRPLGEVRNRLRSFDRDSLGLDSYLQLDSSAVASLGWEPFDDLQLSLGVGYGFEWLFALQETDQTPEYVTDHTRHYPLGRAGFDWVISRGKLRRDKHHELGIEFEFYQVEEGPVTRLEFDYQKVWEFGFQDLFWRVDGTSVVGDGVQWQDEEPISSSILRAVAGEEEFARNMGQSGLEYRLSLHRDLLKISGSAGAGVAGLVDRQTRRPFIEFFASAGPGIHLLLLDNFEASAYYSFGWREADAMEGEFSFRLLKVY